MRATRAACLALLLVRGHAHPMHTAVAELTQLDARGATSVQLRLFADDFEAAVPPAADRAAATGPAVERGRDAVRGRPALNPPLCSVDVYDGLWERWGLAAKPSDYARAVRERYGLHEAPYENGGLPMGLQFVAKPLEEERLLQIGNWVEGVLGRLPAPQIAATGPSGS